MERGAQAVATEERWMPDDEERISGVLTKFSRLSRALKWAISATDPIVVFSGAPCAGIEKKSFLRLVVAHLCPQFVTSSLLEVSTTI